MIRFQIKHFILTAALVTAFGFVGCNLFNPTENVNINSSDANALTYEGYIKFRNNEYTEASTYFSKAIEADSTHSEAWYGLAKAKLNMRGLNSFELLKYVDLNGGTSSALALTEMDDETAKRYEDGIGEVVTFLKEFIQRDTTGRLDGVITYKTISESYMLLNMVNTMLTLRKTTASLKVCNTINPTTGKLDCDVGTVLNSLKGGTITETIESVHEIFSSCESNPEVVASVIGGSVPVFGAMLTEDGQTTSTSAICGAMSSITEDSGDSLQNEQTLSAIISMAGYSDITDDDGDGCFDEEIFDGVDNDGDGLVDEDLRDANNKYTLDTKTITANKLAMKNETKDVMVYSSLRPNEKYKIIDIDMNGKTGEEDNDEWDYIYPDYAERVSKNDYRLKFATKIQFNPGYYPMADFLGIKNAIAADHDGSKYDLAARKRHVGGCWAYYTEEMFEQWKARWRNQ